MAGGAPSLAQPLNNAASYIWGNCTWFVAQTLSWVPSGLGNAKDWAANASKRGLNVSQTPRAGDVVVYGYNPSAGYPSPFGHVAVVESVQSPQRFTVSEMNVKGLGIQDTRSSSLAGVLGFIEPPKAANQSNDPAPWDIAGQLGAGFGALGGSINTSISDATTKITDTLNPLNWLMALWNDHLKGEMARIVLIAVGIWILVVGIKIMFADDAESSTTTNTTNNTTVESSKDDKPASESEPAAEGAEADSAAVAAA